MATVFFDRVRRASFDLVEFPVNSIEIVGGLRDHIHEFPHADGGIPEKLGRKLYVMKLHAVFDEGITSYPDNYPHSLALLRSSFEAGTTATLVIPQLGGIKAYCRSWPQKWNWQVRSGEEADFEFVEDDEITDLDVFTSTAPSVPTMSQQLESFNLAAEAQQIRLAAQQAITLPSAPLNLSLASPVSRSLIDSVRSAFNAVMVARDQEELAFIILEQKLASASQAISQLDRAITSPLDLRLMEAARDMQTTVRSIQTNAKNTIASIKTFRVPRLMSVTEVSRILFGDTTHAMDILQMNAIENAFAIPAGFTLRYIDSTTGQGNASVTNPTARNFIAA